MTWRTTPATYTRHPVQAVIGGTLIGAIVLAHALIDRRASWPALAKPAGTAALGLAAARLHAPVQCRHR